MVDNYKVVTNSPYGRKRYVEILVHYLLKCRPVIDKHVFWLNTGDKEDLEYLDSLVASYPDFFEVIKLPYIQEWAFTSRNVHRFYEYCTDPDTIYLKIDDDIVWFDVANFENFIKFRIENPQYFLVFANTINNGVNYYVHQKLGAITTEEFPAVEYSSMNVAWQNYSYAIKSFQSFIECYNTNTLDKFRFDRWVLTDYERYSINFFCWFGSEFAKFEKCGRDDEMWLSVHKPREREMPNCIYGNMIAVHYAYFTQREKLDAQPKILDVFRDLVRDLY